LLAESVVPPPIFGWIDPEDVVVPLVVVPEEVLVVFPPKLGPFA
jgi:hypothetical protein